MHKIIAASIGVAALLGAAGAANASVITATDFTPGLNNQTIQGVNFTASGGTFDLKTVAGFTGVGVSGGTAGEIDIGESIAGTGSFFLNGFSLAFLFNGPEFGDVLEVAVVTINGNVYTLTTQLNDTSAIWTGPGAVANVSPADANNAAVWAITGIDLVVQSIGFSAAAGACGSGTCNNQSDYAIADITTNVPEPATLALLGAGLLGLGFAGRRRRG